MENRDKKKKINFFSERLDVIVRHHSGKEFFLFKSSGINSFLFIILSIVTIFLISFSIFVYTPLVRILNLVGEDRIVPTQRIIDNVISSDNRELSAELIFKYFSASDEKQAVDYNKIVEAIIKTDSLKNEVELWRAYAHNINQIIAGTKQPLRADSVINSLREKGDANATRIALDSILRKQVSEIVEEVESNNLTLDKYKLYPPMIGTITSHFNYTTKTYGITIASAEQAAVMSVNEGTVVMLIWSPKDGYVMQVQHPDNMISVYKGVTRALKEVGMRVGAREVIGYVGNKQNDESLIADSMQTTIETSTDNKLYFEIWKGGVLVDPEKIIIF